MSALQHRHYRCTCGNAVFMRNSACLNCHRQLGYEPERAQIVALHATERDDQWTIDSEGGSAGTGKRYHRCANFHTAAACNWLRPVNLRLPEGDNGLCIACSLNRTIPDQSLPENQVLWQRIEVAKRRLVSQLLGLGLPVTTLALSPWQDAKAGMAFAFLRSMPGQDPVTTGHAHGLITLDAIEADDAERERIAPIFRASALRPIAETYQSMGDNAAALALYKRVVEEGANNKNARPRAEDLSATCRSMALNAAEPDSELWARLREISAGLCNPW